MKRSGAKVIGLDSNMKAIAIATELLTEAHIGDAFDIPYGDNTFDMVMSSGLLEHFTDMEIKELLKEQSRVSKKYVMAMIPNPEDTIYRIWKELLMSSGEWQFGTERPIDLVNLGVDAGLIVEKCVAINADHTYNLLSKISDITGEDYSEMQCVLKRISNNKQVGDNIGYLKVVVMHKVIE
jgi:hypothetical protein